MHWLHWLPDRLQGLRRWVRQGSERCGARKLGRYRDRERRWGDQRDRERGTELEIGTETETASGTGRGRAAGGGWGRTLCRSSGFSGCNSEASSRGTLPTCPQVLPPLSMVVPSASAIFRFTSCRFTALPFWHYPGFIVLPAFRFAVLANTPFQG